MLNAILNNPARIVAAVAALLVLSRTFGAGISDAQVQAILASLEPVLAVVALLFTGEAVRANIKGPVTAKKEASQ